ncbi:hypothetical protein [Streptomyces sp. P9-A2]|uniref:hypothetical protein n=1 Tax=Streptomyces sp. P9-A2 TaxID=3072284 RepID=UPI002FCB3D72
MRKRTLRSVLVAAFSAAMAFGALGVLVDAEGDVRADSSWGVPAPVAGDSSWGAPAPVAGDSSWGVPAPVVANDSSWG